IKVLNVQFQGHPKSLIALQREARKAQTLAHPNIVQVYDFDRDGPMVYLTMEYLQGKPLSQVLRAPHFGGMPYADAMKIVNGMGKALAYAHERGFVHCDFKPANVILTDNGGVKVIDFGIARVFQKAEEEADVTVFDPGSLGALTPAYASPEMIEGREPDPRDDVYALGCMTYELLTGHHPFNRMSAVQARDAGLRPQRPARLGFRQWRALRCSLAFDRNARTASVNQFLQEMGASAPQRSSMTVVAVLAVLAVIGAASVFFLRPSGTPPAENAAADDSHPEEARTVTPAADAPAPAQPVQAQPPPAPPVLTLPAVSAVLAKVPCAALLPGLQGGTVRVQGYLPRSYGQSRLRAELGALPGAAGVEMNVQELDDNKCPVMNVLGRYWVAHRMSGDGAAIRLNPQSGKGGGELVEGDTLMVDLTSPGYQSYVTVDYFVLDGGVVHLLPSPSARENQAPPRYTATIGSLGNWVIAKPFGKEMLVLVATPVPLFDGLRQEIEPGQGYLRALDGRLAQISNSHGAASVAVDFLQISTHAKR
ncbi:MAG TPA: protein kinase, partial [Telluria sp.]|nr:protein kinase [Telluria sp.]